MTLTPRQQRVYNHVEFHPYSTIFDIGGGTGLKKDKVECVLLALSDQGLVQSQMMFSESLRRAVKHWKTI